VCVCVCVCVTVCRIVSLYMCVCVHVFVCVGPYDMTYWPLSILPNPAMIFLREANVAHWQC
jgi:hypothetical protein